MATTNKRISSIDALRGIALFGILLVHSMAFWGYTNGDINDFSFNTNFGQHINAFVYALFEGRCNKVFSMLFGVSFYLILRNPNYTSLKFVWRCVILAGFGAINKLFFSGDTLIWYGILGVILTCFRRLNTRTLFLLFVLFFVLSWFPIKFYTPDVMPERYVAGQSLFDIIKNPFIYGYGRWFTSFQFTDLSFFVLGYYIAQRGIIEELQKYVTPRNILISFILYAIFFIVYYVFRKGLVSFPVEKCSFAKAFLDLFGGFFYILLFLFVYYLRPKIFRHLESYGRLGLTNYSFQGILGVCSTLYIVMPLRLSTEYSIFIYIGIFIVQMEFSHYWLKKYKFGPMEWLWRCLTNLKFVSNVKQEDLLNK